MFRHWFLILFPFIFTITNAQTCSSNTCPTGGIWSEWSTTETCPTTCGACNNLTYTRTCLSTSMDEACECSGLSTRIMACGTQACNYPRYNGTGVICCTGSAMLIGNWYHCGPLASNNTLACCPSGGYWSAWSGWSKPDDKIEFTRNRTCVSADLGCACTGSATETKYTCPCPAITTITSCSTTTKTPNTIRTPYYRAADCSAFFLMDASNFRHAFFDGSDLTTVGWIDTTGTCNVRDMNGTGFRAPGNNGAFYKAKLLCNMTTGRFYGSYFGVPFVDVVEIAQFY